MEQKLSRPSVQHVRIFLVFTTSCLTFTVLTVWLWAMEEHHVGILRLGYMSTMWLFSLKYVQTLVVNQRSTNTGAKNGTRPWVPFIDYV